MKCKNIDISMTVYIYEHKKIRLQIDLWNLPLAPPPVSENSGGGLTGLVGGLKSV